MAQFFKEKPKRSSNKPQKIDVTIQSMDHMAQGVAQHQGKIIFVAGALPDEKVQIQLTENKKHYAKAKLLRIEQTSKQRIAPSCQYYQQCGGCNFQHLAHDEQVNHKRAALAELFNKLAGDEKQAKTLPEIDDILSQPWGYRRKARLSSWFDRQQKQFTLGFRGRDSHNVIGIDACPVLAPVLSQLIKPVAACLGRLQGVASLGHVELIETDSMPMVVIRITQSLSEKDEERLIELGQRQQCAVVLEQDDEQWRYLIGEQPAYELNNSGNVLSLHFNPGNFIQVNAGVNQQMVSRAVEWLAPQPNDSVLDLFCGMGNFSLPIAASGAKVIGVEGVVNLVELAKQNAKDAALDNATFYCTDLNGDLKREPWFGAFDKVLLDPSRAGAFEALAYLPKLSPERVVYVSCNPVSLARDSQQLFKYGYRLEKLTALDMFPQTHHIEAMALFVRSK